MKTRYEAIVIGTGFGGAVAACRLTQAGFDVGVFERGHRYPQQPFPRDFADIGKWIWQLGHGLFDARAFSEVIAIQAAGYGGGSLVYANVQVRPPKDVFESGWPPGYSLESLEKYYDLVSYMLDVKPITKAAGGLPPKAQRMQKAAQDLGRSKQFFYPNIAVNFGPQDPPTNNKFGASQRGCNYCGECVIGCERLAKNTLDLNYLKVAEDGGADINTDCEVTKIERSGERYKVTFRQPPDSAERTCEAPYVFLCAGAINSTELLLRCRDEYRSLEKLSPQLGHRYSGNGDFIALAFDSSVPLEPSNGPTITSAVLCNLRDGDNPVSFLLQEGGYPRQWAALIHLLHPDGRWLEEVADIRLLEKLREAFTLRMDSAIKSTAPLFGHPDHTAVFLSMGRDSSDGVIRLATPAPGIFIEWNVPSNLPLYDAETRLDADFAAQWGGKLVLNPTWKLMHIPVSVHNLGGCPMGTEPGLGVTDPYGEVFGYPGLYVLDGSILPAAIGVNPAQTIAAVAERNIEAAVRKIKGIENWRAPQMEEALKNPVPDPILRVPQTESPAPITSPLQLSFSETLRGYISKDVAPFDYSGGERAGRNSNSVAVLCLTIITPNLDDFLIDKSYSAPVEGIVRVDGITGPDGAPVRKGIFNLFVAERNGHFYQRKMLYHLPFRDSNGSQFILEGFKDIRDHGRFDIWGATTTLYSVVRTAEGEVVASGIIRIRLPDFLRQLTTFRVTGSSNILRRTYALLRFFQMFVRTLFDVFVRPRMPGAT